MDSDHEINYKTLRRIQQGEQTSSLLTKLHGSFYPDLVAYMKNLEKTVEHEQNPQKLKLFSDEIQNTKKIASSIYEFREKKIVQAALSTIRSGTPDLTNMLEVEKKLYEALVVQISSSRKEIFEQQTHQKEIQKDIKKPDPIKQSVEPVNTHPIVTVVEDTPEFVGTDEKTYSLRKEDVLSMPSETSRPLLKKGVVKQVK